MGSRQFVERQLAWRSVALAAALLGLLLLSSTTGATSASGWESLGCKMSGTSPELRYQFHSVSSTNQTRTNSAAARWNSTNAPGNFVATSSGDPNIDIYDGAHGTGQFWAWVTWSCGTGGIFTSNEVDLTINQSHTGFTSTEWRKILVHEFGHTYGLDHTDLTCASPGPSVMRQGTAKFACTGLEPWADDVNGVHAIY